MELKMLVLKLRQIGNSLGVVLPREALAKLNVGVNDTLFLTEAPNGGMHLTPYDPAIEEQIRLGREVAAEYRDTLRALSK
jgi:putative addiction module antidote